MVVEGIRVIKVIKFVKESSNHFSEVNTDAIIAGYKNFNECWRFILFLCENL